MNTSEKLSRDLRPLSELKVGDKVLCYRNSTDLLPMDKYVDEILSIDSTTITTVKGCTFRIEAGKIYVAHSLTEDEHNDMWVHNAFTFTNIRELKLVAPIALT